MEVIVNGIVFTNPNYNAKDAIKGSRVNSFRESALNSDIHICFPETLFGFPLSE